MPAQKRTRVSKNAPKESLLKRQKTKKRETKKKNRFQVGFWSIVFVLAVMLLVFLYRLITHSAWKGQERLNLVVGNEKDTLALVSIAAGESDVVVFVLDESMMMETVLGYGEYKAGSLLTLGELERKGSQLLVDSVERTLGLPVHGYLSRKTPADLGEGGELKWVQNLWQPMLLTMIGSPFGTSDIWRLTTSTSTLRPDQVEVVRLHESRLAYTQELPDGTQVFRIDPLRLDGYLRDRFKGLVYTNEGYGVTVINTTSQPGVATVASRILLNIGVDVVGTGENQDNLTSTVVLYSDEEIKKSQTLETLRMVLPSFKLVEGDTSEYRAAVVVLLGDDYGDYLHRKSSD